MIGNLFGFETEALRRRRECSGIGRVEDCLRDLRRPDRASLEQLRHSLTDDSLIALRDREAFFPAGDEAVFFSPPDIGHLIDGRVIGDKVRDYAIAADANGRSGVAKQSLPRGLRRREPSVGGGDDDVRSRTGLNRVACRENGCGGRSQGGRVIGRANVIA